MSPRILLSTQQEPSIRKAHSSTKCRWYCPSHNNKLCLWYRMSQNRHKIAACPAAARCEEHVGIFTKIESSKPTCRQFPYFNISMEYSPPKRHVFAASWCSWSFRSAIRKQTARQSNAGPFRTGQNRPSCYSMSWESSLLHWVLKKTLRHSMRFLASSSVSGQGLNHTCTCPSYTAHHLHQKNAMHVVPVCFPSALRF
jgi:hypothetical protein